MDRGRDLLRRIANDTDPEQLLLPGLPIAEIAGDSRVLVENHQGVKAYCGENVLIKVSYGCIRVCGDSLELMKMSKNQLVIQGKIDSVTIHRSHEGW